MYTIYIVFTCVCVSCHWQQSLRKSVSVVIYGSNADPRVFAACGTRGFGMSCIDPTGMHQMHPAEAHVQSLGREQALMHSIVTLQNVFKCCYDFVFIQYLLLEYCIVVLHTIFFTVIVALHILQ